MTIKHGHIHWFIHEQDQTPLGFARLRNGGALILGGKTGSHLSGHVESYWKKFKEVINLGYMPVEIAIEFKIIHPEWAPPEITSPTEIEWIAKIERNEM